MAEDKKDKTPNIGKFIFTDEGKRMIVAQDGGIHFAVMGVVLLNSDTLTEDTVKTLTWEQLKDGEYGTLAMKGVNYLCNGSNILPEDDLAYNSAINDIFARASKTENTYLFDCRYHPDMGVKDKDGLCYGMYDFNFNKTMLMWTGGDPSFNAIIVLGKQYVTDKDAPYSVADSQNPTVVGAIISVKENDDDVEAKPLVQFMAEQNEYVEFKFQWRITFTDNPIVDNIGLEQIKTLKDANDKFQLTNNGLKTDGTKEIRATVDDVIINEFNLNENGNFATSKSIMVADVAPSDELDFKYNSSLLNTINCGNKEDARQENKAYKDHRTLYSFAYEGDITKIGENTITAAAMIETLRSNEPMTTRHPVYAPWPLSTSYNSYEKSPVYETRVMNANVSLFGVNEFIHTTASRAIFSNNNLRMLVSNDYTANYIFSNSNFEYYAPYNNTYIKSDGNTAYNGANNNSLFNSNLNLLHDSTNNNLLIGSNNNELYNGANHLLLLMSNENSGFNGMASAAFIYSNRNNVEDDCPQLMLLNSNDCSAHDSGGANSLIMNSKSAHLYNGATNVTMLDTLDCKMYNGASGAILIGEKNSEINNTSLYTYLIAGSANIVTNGCSGTSIFASHSNHLGSVKDVTIINGYDNGYNDAGRASYYCQSLQDSIILNSRNTDKFSYFIGPSIYSNKAVINAIGIKGNAVSVKGSYDGHEIYLGQYNNKLSPYNEDSLVPLIIGGGVNDTYRYNALTFELVKSFNFNGTDYTDKNNYEYKGLLKTDAIYANIGISAKKAKFNDGLTANSITIENATNFTIGGTSLTNYVDNEIEQKAKPTARTFFAEIFVDMANNVANTNFKPTIGAWYDTGTDDKNASPMYQRLLEWLACGLFGYSDGDNDPNGNSYYYLENGTYKASAKLGAGESIMIGTTQNTHARFGFANEPSSENKDYKFPYMFGYIPDGYSFIELNVHFVDIDNEDYIFPLIPIVNSFNQQTRVRVNLISCSMHSTSDNNSAEDVHFWIFNRYSPRSGTTDVEELKDDFKGLFELRKELNVDNDQHKMYRFADIAIDDGCGICLECVAVPKNTDANAEVFANASTMRPVSIGWKLLNKCSLRYDD